MYLELRLILYDKSKYTDMSFRLTYVGIFKRNAHQNGERQDYIEDPRFLTGRKRVRQGVILVLVAGQYTPS